MKILEILPKGTRAYSDALEASKAIEAARKAGQTDIADAKAAVLDTLFDQFQQNKGNPKAVKKIESAFASATRDAISFGREFLKDSSLSKSEINEKNAALEIERALNLGDERGLILPASDVKFAAEAIAKGDNKKAADYATRLSSRIESLIKQQDEESKTLVKTPEGEQFSIGDKTGTMYRAGIPVSRGQENTGMFNAFSSKAFEPTKEVGASIPIIGAVAQEVQAPSVETIETVRPAPEVYGVEVTPAKMTSMQEKEQAFKRARELYNSGDDASAIDLMNAAGGKGMLGPFMTEDLSMVFGERKAQPPTPQPTATPASTIPQQAPQLNKTSKGTTYKILD